MLLKSNSLSSSCSSPDMGLQRRRRTVYCDCSHLEQSLEKSLREAIQLPPTLPLMSKHSAHSSRPAADLAVLQRAFRPANVATYVG